MPAMAGIPLSSLPNSTATNANSGPSTSGNTSGHVSIPMPGSGQTIELDRSFQEFDFKTKNNVVVTVKPKANLSVNAPTGKPKVRDVMEALTPNNRGLEDGFKHSKERALDTTSATVGVVLKTGGEFVKTGLVNLADAVSRVPSLQSGSQQYVPVVPATEVENSNQEEHKTMMDTVKESYAKIAPPVGSLIAIAIPEEAKKAVMDTVKDYVAPAAVGAYFASNYGARLEARQGEKKALDVAAKKLEVIGEEEMDPNNDVHKAALAAYEAYVPLQEATYPTGWVPVAQQVGGALYNLGFSYVDPSKPLVLNAAMEEVEVAELNAKINNQITNEKDAAIESVKTATNAAVTAATESVKTATNAAVTAATESVKTATNAAVTAAVTKIEAKATDLTDSPEFIEKVNTAARALFDAHLQSPEFQKMVSEHVKVTLEAEIYKLAGEVGHKSVAAETNNVQNQQQHQQLGL
ncbi:hypothetical protein BDR26DRAFT_943110 [Obelidium mucronatum]|nr:hypothetical protein BDR26DRAFT_943110 [Obelidium mucronatum]